MRDRILDRLRKGVATSRELAELGGNWDVAVQSLIDEGRVTISFADQDTTVYALVRGAAGEVM